MSTDRKCETGYNIESIDCFTEAGQIFRELITINDVRRGGGSLNIFAYNVGFMDTHEVSASVQTP